MMVAVEVEVEGGRMMQSGSLVLSSDAHWFGGDSGRIGRPIITDILSKAYFLYLESINAIN